MLVDPNMSHQNTTFLALGSNLGDRKSYLTQAIHEISTKVGFIVKVSKFYRTEPLNPDNISDQPEFLNAVLEVKTDLSPGELLAATQRIEAGLGLDRSAKIPWGPRIIDIDILTYEDQVVSEPDLIIPHKEMCNRDFVLIPLNEIAPAFVHPTNKKQISQLIQELDARGALNHMIAPMD